MNRFRKFRDSYYKYYPDKTKPITLKAFLISLAYDFGSVIALSVGIQIWFYIQLQPYEFDGVALVLAGSPFVTVLPGTISIEAILWMIAKQKAQNAGNFWKSLYKDRSTLIRTTYVLVVFFGLYLGPRFLWSNYVNKFIDKKTSIREGEILLNYLSSEERICYKKTGSYSRDFIVIKFTPKDTFGYKIYITEESMPESIRTKLKPTERPFLSKDDYRAVAIKDKDGKLLGATVGPDKVIKNLEFNP